MNSPVGQLIYGTGDLRQAERYKAGRKDLLSNKKIDWAGGHSLGGAVALQLQKDFPNRVKKTVTWGAPVWDPFGRQKKEIGQENVDRYSNEGDLVSIFDNSAKKTRHPNPLDYAPSFMHDFHNKAEAGGTLGGKPLVTNTVPKMNTIDNTTKTTWEAQPFDPFDIVIPYSNPEEQQKAE